jgi:hypothetical protein
VTNDQQRTTDGNGMNRGSSSAHLAPTTADFSTTTTKENNMAMNANELRDALHQCTGSERLYGMGPLFRAVITDGVKLLADEAQCFWLLTDALAWVCQKVPGKNYDDGFMVIELKPAEDGSADLRITTGNDGVPALYTQRYESHSFPLHEGIKLYAVWSQASEERGPEWHLMIPSEY